MPFQIEPYTFDPRPQYPLVTTAKRYWHPDLCCEEPDALTLIFLHGTGFHKEHWEPTFEDLFEAISRDQASPSGLRTKIHEIWSLDCPNHGDAAVINEEELRWGYWHVFAWEEYARSLHAFLQGNGTGIPVDFSKRKLVGIGHSMGAIAVMLSTTYVCPVTFSSIMLVEPMLLHPPWIVPESTALAEGARKRRDIWPSRDAAYDIMSARPSWRVWDPRVLKAFTEHGLRDLPTTTYPDQQGVTLTCTKAQEVASYSDQLGRARAAKYLSTLCSQLPVHMIQGAVNEPYLPLAAKDYTVKVSAAGKLASVQRVPHAGHLIVQTHPKGLAAAIYNALKQDAATAHDSSTAVVSRL